MHYLAQTALESLAATAAAQAEFMVKPNLNTGHGHGHLQVSSVLERAPLRSQTSESASKLLLWDGCCVPNCLYACSSIVHAVSAVGRVVNDSDIRGLECTNFGKK